MLFSALFALLLENVYRSFFPSTKSHQIILAEKSLRETQYLVAELDTEITNLNLVLHLRRPLRAADFVGEAFLVRIRNFDRPKSRNFEILLEVAESWGTDHEYSWGFNVESFFMEDRVRLSSNYTLIGRDTELSVIPLPLSLLHSIRKPFKNVRDLDGSVLEIFAPDHFARYISQVRLIANSGFQFTKHTLLYSRGARESDWEQTGWALGNNFSSRWSSDAT